MSPRAVPLSLLLAAAACRGNDGGGVPVQPAPTTAPPPRDGGPPPSDAAPPWTDALSAFPHVEPLRVIALPTRATEPRFDVGGPAILGTIAVVSSSQFGFIGVDWRAGTIAWTKPAGSRVAPPLARPGSAILIGDCLTPPAVAESDQLLGCLRAVSPTGADQVYVAIHGPAVKVAVFLAAAGPQRVWSTSDRTVTWRRGAAAISVDTLTGVAQPVDAAAAADPPIPVHYRDKTWDITRAADGTLHARRAGHDAWHTERPYDALLGGVYLPEQAPMVRAANLGHYSGAPELTLFDIDATGSMHGQVAFPVPALGVLGSAVSSVGDAALAIRLDRSLRHDYIVGYAASALLMYVYPLPDVPRADPVGVAVTPEAVVVFHDGDTVTVLPELSAPPTAAGAARAPSENATP